MSKPKTVPKYKRHLAYQPVVNHGTPDANPWTKEYKDFWSMQVQRCVNGYNPPGHTWIPGRYYFFLNFCRMLTAYGGTKRKVMDYPFYRDVDHEYFDKVERARKEGKGMIVLKSRRKGATMMNIGGVCVYEMTIPHGNEIGLGCFSEDQVMAFKSRFEDMYSTLPNFFKQRRIKSNEDMVKFGEVERIVGVDTEVGSKNTMYFKDFFNKTGAFRGHSLSFLLFEEAGENPILKRAYLVSEECFREGGYQFGTPIIFGTSNQINNGFKDLEEMYFNAEKYNLIKHFIPAPKVYFPFFDISTGKSDMEGATKDIQKKIAVKKSLEDKMALYTFMQEMPLKESDCFMLGASGQFNLELIHRQLEFLSDNKRERGKVQRGKLEWQADPHGQVLRQVEWEIDPNGKMYQLYPPMNKADFSGPDVGGVDPYKKDKSKTSDSLGSLHIYRDVAHLGTPDELPVFEYCDRPSTKDQFYEECAKICVYYNMQILVEDTDEEFFSWFINNGFVKYLKPAPVIYNTVYTKASNRYGYNIAGSGKKEKLVGVVADYIERHCHKIYFPKLLKEMTIFGLKNTDRVMSFGMALIHSIDNAHLRMQNRASTDQIKPMKFPGLKMKDGIITPVHSKTPSVVDNSNEQREWIKI